MPHQSTHIKLTTKEGGLITRLGLDVADVKSRISRMEVKAGTVLFAPGDETKIYLVLLTGQIRVDLITKSDREIALYRVKESQTCLITTTALLKSEVYFAKGVAETDITALALPAQYFHEALAISPVFSRYVLSDYARRVESLVGLVDRLTSKDLQADILRELRSHADKDGLVKITQVDLARNIGTAREVVSRKLKMMNAQGLIKYADGGILVLERPK